MATGLRDAIAALDEAIADATDRARHLRDRVARAAGDGWVLDCSAGGGSAISAALSQPAETMERAS